MPRRDLTLYTFAVSHFCEKVRWTLDQAGIRYEEKPMTPVFHLWSAWHMGGRGATTLPILKASNGPVPRDHIQDSTRILLWLAAEYGLGALLPTERSLSDQVSAIEDRFDVIGHHVNRVIYAQALQHDEQVLRFWNSSATPQQDRWLRLAFPLIKWGCMRRMRLQADAVRQSQHRLQQTLAWLDGRLSDGRRYLVGGQLSLADISVASILAPLACPS